MPNPSYSNASHSQPLIQYTVTQAAAAAMRTRTCPRWVVGIRSATLITTPAIPCGFLAGLRVDGPERLVRGRDVDDQPTADLSRAPLPTAATLRRRRSLPFQLTRFAVFNARIMRMVVKGEH